MPQLAVAIPVLYRTNTPHYGRGKWPAGRKYNDGPLPTKLSDHAPRNARITGRVADTNGVVYTLKIGEVELTNIGVDEILDYVSPLYLEQYENSQFVEEREVLAALEVEKQVLQQQKWERQKERARTKGTVFFEEFDSDDDVTGAESGDLGALGRARPTYTHLFKKPLERKRRKRDPYTGELLPLSDDDENGSDGIVSTEEDVVAPGTFARSTGSFVQLPYKRRRRKRDKITGELLPLSPIEQQQAQADKKRQRRRRHPLTGELMPLGWKYDPDNEDEDEDMPTSQSLRKLSLVEGHEAKRPRLTSTNPRTSSSSPPAAEHGLAGNVSGAHRSNQRAVVDLSTPRAKVGAQTVKFKSPTDPVTKTQFVDLSHVEASSPSPEPELRTSITQPTARWRASISPARRATPRSKPTPNSVKGVTTSLVTPSARHPFQSSAPLSDGDSGAEEDDDEWEVEQIYEHRYSDPKTHPPNIGNAPVMLYRTKWVGSDELTWEPLVSFGDWEIVRDYRRRVGLPSEPSDAGETEEEEERNQTKISPAAAQVHVRSHSLLNDVRDPILATGETDDSGSESDSNGNGNSKSESGDEVDDERFEFEAILSHHLSDPRTHPPQLGKTPVMLYQVKWKGWEEPTWEPSGSFEDPRMLDEYRRKVGLRGER